MNESVSPSKLWVLTVLAGSFALYLNSVTELAVASND